MADLLVSWFVPSVMFNVRPTNSISPTTIDLSTNNIMVASDGTVTCLINWEFAFTFRHSRSNIIPLSTQIESISSEVMHTKNLTTGVLSMLYNLIIQNLPSLFKKLLWNLNGHPLEKFLRRGSGSADH
jgi:hypothetical protein